MFLGEYAHTLDPKGRLTIPARFREELASGLVITKGYEPCLVVLPQSQCQMLAEKVAQMPMSSRAVRSYARRFFGGAAEVVPDKMGRVLIPGFLREYAQIDDEALIVGANTWVEIWNPEQFRRAVEEDSANMDTYTTEVTKMGV